MKSNLSFNTRAETDCDMVEVCGLVNPDGLWDRCYKGAQLVFERCEIADRVQIQFLAAILEQLGGLEKQ